MPLFSMFLQKFPSKKIRNNKSNGRPRRQRTSVSCDWFISIHFFLFFLYFSGSFGRLVLSFKVVRVSLKTSVMSIIRCY